MHADFHEIEESMDKLVEEMGSIGSITSSINSSMRENRAEIADLVAQSDTLTKVRFLFELPNELKAKIEAKDLSGAVKDYEEAAKVLDNYKQHPSFESIQAECGEALQVLVAKLYEPFDQIEPDNVDVAALVESVDLLVKLDMEVRDLSETFLKRCIKPTEELLEFSSDDCVAYVTHICNHLAELSVHVASFQNIFSQTNLKCPIKQWVLNIFLVFLSVF